MKSRTRSAKIFHIALTAALVLTILDPFLVHQPHSVQAAFPSIDIIRLVSGASGTSGKPYPYPSNEPPPVTPIHTIQGAGHVSEMAGGYVSATGVVTGVRSDGFYIEDPVHDNDPATSEGIFVQTEAFPAIEIGDYVQVTGTVTEYRPFSPDTDLSTTEITMPVVVTLPDNAPLPVPVVLGTGGRIPPGAIIENDAAGDVETSAFFDPASDGLDFYESLEGMRVQVNGAEVVGPRSANGEIPIIGDGGQNASTRTGRGGIVVKSGDFNPERIFLDDEIIKHPSLLQTMPPAEVGDSIPNPIVGIMDYSGGNYKLQVNQAPVLKSVDLPTEMAPTVGRNQLAIATLNVDNLNYRRSEDKFKKLANQIVNALRSPDILLLEEIQDDDGADDHGEVDAQGTLKLLIIEIGLAGGPVYEYRQIDPDNNLDGGQPGGNIRVAFLFREDRGLSFVNRGAASANTENSVYVNRDGFAYLDYSPGRIEPSNLAFVDSRKPLAGEFLYHGQRLFVIGNHFVSRRGDQPLFGRFQPPDFSSQVKRELQAQVVHDFVQAILTIEPQAYVVVLGDLNDYPFSAALTALKGNPQILYNLMDTLPVSERYSVVYEGNSEGLDHILVSPALFRHSFVYDSVHVNAEYADEYASSDHDPQVLVVNLNQTPIVAGRIPDQSITIGETYSYTVPANIFSDPDPETLGYTAALENGALLPAWLNFDRKARKFIGTPGLNDPGTQTIRVTATDPSGASISTTFRLNVLPKVFYSRIFLPLTRK